MVYRLPFLDANSWFEAVVFLFANCCFHSGRSQKLRVVCDIENRICSGFKNVYPRKGGGGGGAGRGRREEVGGGGGGC